MRIAHVIDHFQPQMGYQEVYLAREQARLGHEVVVVTSNRLAHVAEHLPGGRIVPAGRSEEIPGVQVVRLPVAVETPTVYAYVWMPRLPAVLRELAPDLVHCHNVFSWTAVQVGWAKRSLGFGLVYDNHMAAFNTYWPFEPRWRRTVKQLVYPALGRLMSPIVLRAADALTALGEPERDFVVQLFGARCLPVPIVRLGADSEQFRFRPEGRARVRSEKGYQAAEVVLGHSGAVRPSKGVDVLIRAAGTLLEQDVPVRVLVTGKGEPDYLAHLEEVARQVGLGDRLGLQGFVPVEDLPDYLSAMDIGVWPGDMSITVIEAMAVGLPVVARRSAYTEAVIECHGAGALFDGSDPARAARAILPLARDQALRSSRGTQARQAVEEHLNWTSIARQFLDLYADVLRRRARAS